ncbi:MULTISPECIES: ABC transporter ATP-binding protein [Carnobacterium]|uniref:ABC transporter ATP-binding protein n=1 Tax=Carnobacterium TaxID=2747 RepID=UPI001072B2ED|nr:MULTISPECIES: ABC transporter ATP-binding protein [Carnobacterium]MDT1940873.1 ABC transporter ATP-binding protein [Carnobacterium divergens]MDT1943312.1 ABC transporter ATP-binding protein [Carnobacterium divergens]MDT1949119.1 ABC transporter ATP-binding protein [Carnobacterium divergens]MDT1951642.1 ABC transporter ATP-binding protein [Carnobacterium divergens]MDT1956777.1 ABC transporter ATP-binding protein [Carnobacterium divergens]
MITAKNIGYWYDKGATPLYQHVNLTFDQGVLYSILGSSGSGKTTFLSLISGLDKPKEGEILYEGKAINKMGLTNFRNQKVSIVFQAYNLLPYMTALENIVTAMEITKSKERDKKNYALQMLKRVGIDEALAKKNVMHLSGGQQQRIAIVRAMCCDTKFIVADEPTGNLDEETSRDIIRLFQELAHKENKCIILVTHEQEVAKESDVCIQLKDKQFSII